MDESAPDSGFSVEGWADEHVVSEAPEPEGADLDYGEESYEDEQPYEESYEPEPYEEDFTEDRSTPDVSAEYSALRQMQGLDPSYPAEEDLDAEDAYDPDLAVARVAEIATAAQQTFGAEREQLAAERKAIEDERTIHALGKLEEKYPDLGRDQVQRDIAELLRPVAADVGGDVRLSPRLIELAYLAHRATQMGAREVRPSQMPRGAHLESAAGASVPTSEDPDAKFKRDLLSTSGGGVLD